MKKTYRVSETMSVTIVPRGLLFRTIVFGVSGQATSAALQFTPCAPYQANEYVKDLTVIL